MNNPPPFISVPKTPGISGFFAVMFTWNNEMDVYEPAQTGMGRYATLAEAQAEGRYWANAEGLEYLP